MLLGTAAPFREQTAAETDGKQAQAACCTSSHYSSSLVLQGSGWRRAVPCLASRPASANQNMLVGGKSVLAFNGLKHIVMLQKQDGLTADTKLGWDICCHLQAAAGVKHC